MRQGCIKILSLRNETRGMFLIKAQYEKGLKRDKQTISLVDFLWANFVTKFLTEVSGAVVIRHMMFSRILIRQSLESLTTYKCFDSTSCAFCRTAKNGFDGIDGGTEVSGVEDFQIF